MRIIDETYYDSAYWSWLLKTRQISQPAVIHHKPEFYGLTLKDAINARIRYLRANLTVFLAEYEAIKGQYLRGTMKQWALPYLFFPKWKIDCEVKDNIFPKPFFNLSISEFKELVAYYVGVNNDWPYKLMNSWQEKIESIKKSIHFNRQRLNPDNKHESYDIARIKQIPINTIIEILPSGFFRNNPFRNEKSPSNSLHWDKKSNRYYDFATNQHGDIIDLYKAINNCDLKTALKELSSL